MIEEEKVNRRKGGEYLPLRTLMRLRHYAIDDLYIVNFFGDVDYNRLLAALCNRRPDAMKRFISTTRVHEVEINHHHTHAIAAVLEAWTGLIRTAQPGGAFHVLVADGIGHDCEATTLYSVAVNPERPFQDSVATLRVIEKIHANQLSCGMLFGRIACNADTGFAVLKDESKTLGYEIEIRQFLTQKRKARVDAIIDRLANAFVLGRPHHLVSRLRADILRLLPEAATYSPAPASLRLGPPALRPISLSLLPDGAANLLSLRREPTRVLRAYAREEYFGHGLSVRRFQQLSSSFVPAPNYLKPWLVGLDRDQIRIVCSYVANQFIEAYVLAFLRRHQVTDLIVGGGLHFNVKLNRTLLRAIHGRFSATPLAGDIAHVPAVAAILHPELAPRLTSLRWLARTLTPPRQWLDTEDIIHVQDAQHFVELCATRISQGKIVNIIKGWGEYGPRALLNSSTLCLPSEENRRIINILNGRDDRMPMAPVLREEDVIELFEVEEARRVIGSLTSMIVALTWRTGIDPAWYGGVMHRCEDGRFSGRPQVVCRDDHVNHSILTKVAVLTCRLALINTSFNIHGKATVLTLRHAFHDFAFQRRQAQKNGLPAPLLLIGDFRD